MAVCARLCAQVLHALTRKFKLSADVDLDQLARSCPVTLSGADLYALCADAWMLAFKRHISSSSSSSSSNESTATDGQQQQQQGGASLQLEVCQCDFQQALAALTPSLSQEELARYLAIKQHYDAQQGFAQKPAAAATAAVEDGPQRQAGSTHS
jgi:peroxin-6